MEDEGSDRGDDLVIEGLPELEASDFDFKDSFGLVHLLDRTPYEQLREIPAETAGLRPVVDAFVRNMGRVDELSQMPLASASKSLARQRGSVAFRQRSGTARIMFRTHPEPGDFEKTVATGEYFTVHDVYWLSPY